MIICLDNYIKLEGTTCPVKTTCSMSILMKPDYSSVARVAERTDYSLN